MALKPNVLVVHATDESGDIAQLVEKISESGALISWRETEVPRGASTCVTHEYRIIFDEMQLRGSVPHNWACNRMFFAALGELNEEDECIP